MTPGRAAPLPRRPDRMRHRVLAREEIAPEHLRVGAVGIAVVAPQPLLAPRPVLRRQPVPGQPRVGVVHRVQVVVEEQDRQRPAVLDDHAPRRRPLVRLVLEERPDPQDRQRQPAARDILPDRHRRHERRATPPPARCPPGAAPRPAPRPVAGAHRREIVAPEADHAEERPDQHPPEQRVVGGEQRPHRPPQPAPDRRVEVVELRVVVRVGQQRVVVVREVQVAEPLVGDEQPERREHQRVVQPPARGRVPVDRLVLERGMLRQHQRQHRQRDPGPERRRRSTSRPPSRDRSAPEAPRSATRPPPVLGRCGCASHVNL